MNRSVFFKFVQSSFWAGVLSGVIIPALLLVTFFPGNARLLSIVLILLLAGGVIGIIVGIIFGFLFSFLTPEFSTRRTALYNTALVISVTLSFIASPVSQFFLAIYLIFGAHPNRYFYSD